MLEALVVCCAHLVAFRCYRDQAGIVASSFGLQLQDPVFFTGVLFRFYLLLLCEAIDVCRQVIQCDLVTQLFFIVLHIFGRC